MKYCRIDLELASHNVNRSSAHLIDPPTHHSLPSERIAAIHRLQPAKYPSCEKYPESNHPLILHLQRKVRPLR